MFLNQLFKIEFSCKTQTLISSLYGSFAKHNYDNSEALLPATQQHSFFLTEGTNWELPYFLKVLI